MPLANKVETRRLLYTQAIYNAIPPLTSEKNLSIWTYKNNREPAIVTTDSCFNLIVFGSFQRGVAPGVDQQLLADQQLQPNYTGLQAYMYIPGI